MATTASRSVETSSESRRGVAPLRAGQGRSFLLRRLHSLSGIFPIGAYLLEHFFSNAFALNGPHAYARQAKLLTGLPLVIWLELFFIWLPIAFHSIYGFWIWRGGQLTVKDYPWAGNWMYSAQRWSGAIAFPYIVFHTYTMRFAGVHIFDHPGAIFGKVQLELFSSNLILAFWVVGIVATVWHFAYGIWLFAAKWGLVTGERARRRLGYICLAFGIMLGVLALRIVYEFFLWPQMPVDPAGASQIETGPV